MSTLTGDSVPSNGVKSVRESTGNRLMAQSSADVVDGNFFGGTNVYDNSAGWQHAEIRLSLPHGCANGAWNDNPAVHVYARRIDSMGQSGKSDPAPSGSDGKGLQRRGSFTLDDHATVSTAQNPTATIYIGDMEKFELYAMDDTGRDLDDGASSVEIYLDPITPVMAS